MINIFDVDPFLYNWIMDYAFAEQLFYSNFKDLNRETSEMIMRQENCFNKSKNCSSS